MIELKKNPTGEVQIGSTVTNSIDMLGTVDDEKVVQLRSTVDQLKTEIAQVSSIYDKRYATYFSPP